MSARRVRERGSRVAFMHHILKREIRDCLLCDELGFDRFFLVGQHHHSCGVLRYRVHGALPAGHHPAACAAAGSRPGTARTRARSGTG